jgi:hemolysin activation/secretion protein
MKRRARGLSLSLTLSVALGASFGGAIAQTIPSSGELLQQAARPVVQTPSSNVGLRIDQPAPDRLPSSDSFMVRHIEISGNSLLPSSELDAMVSPSEGKMLNLSYLEDLAARITERYQKSGYLLSRAYIPPQTLSDGTVRVVVLEARYGAVALINNSRVSDALLMSYLTPLKPGGPVVEDGLQHSLLLLSDVPGSVVSSSLAAGTDIGTSDLQVTASPGALYSGSVGLDDAGNRYTGRARLSATVDVDNPLHLGDVFALSGLSAGPGLTYGRVGYQALVDNGEGTVVGGALSGLYYHLGNGLSALHAHGTAVVETVTAMQPLIRTIAGNLFVQIAFDSKQLRDEIDATEIHTDRRTNAVTMTLAGDHRDTQGISNMNLGLSLGHLDIDNDAAENADASSAKTRGSYAKYTLSLARLQALNESNSVYVALNGQAANKNLDPSEQFFLGGPNSVRAYDVGTLGGALGVLASAEFRHNIRAPSGGTWQTIAFVDSGLVRIYENVFDTRDNSAMLTGAGVGLNWSGGRGWTVAMGVAKPIGAVPVLVGDTSTARVWVEVHKAFIGEPSAQ